MNYYEFYGLEAGLILNSSTLVVATKKMLTIFKIALDNSLIMRDTLDVELSMSNILELKRIIKR